MVSEIEMIALNVGKGDATIIRYEGYTCLIDTGRYSARKQLLAALKYLDITALDAVFITHTHNDHSGGLRKLRKIEMPIGAIYASKYHPACEKKEHPAVRNAEKMDMRVHWLSAGDVVPLGKSGGVFRVVAPISQIRSNENDNSLVLLLETKTGRVLLAGDMELKEESALLHSKVDISCAVLKVPDHGAEDACSEKLLKACGAVIAVISTNSEEKPETPSERLLRLLKKHGCACYVTQESPIGIRVRVKNGIATAERIQYSKESDKHGD